MDKSFGVFIEANNDILIGQHNNFLDCCIINVKNNECDVEMEDNLYFVPFSFFALPLRYSLTDFAYEIFKETKKDWVKKMLCSIKWGITIRYMVFNSLRHPVSLSIIAIILSIIGLYKS